MSALQVYDITKENLKPLKGKKNTIFRPVGFADRFVGPNTYSKFGPKSFLQKWLEIMLWHWWASLWVTWHFPSNHWFFYKIVEYQKLLFLVLPLVSLHNHNDDDENKNIKKGTDLINKTNTLNVQYTFCTFVKLDRKGIAIVGVISMIIASSRVGLWFPPKYPCRVSQVLAHLLLLYRLWTPGVYQN